MTLPHWTIRIPYRNANDPIIEAGFAAREAINDPEERAVTREVIAGLALEPGISTVQDALDHLEGLSPAERRQLADRARHTVGLETITSIEKRREQAAATRWPPPPSNHPPGRDAQGLWIPVCAAEGCEAIPTRPGGAPLRVPDRKWWCEAHKDQAGPEDHLPPDLRVRVIPRTGQPMLLPRRRDWPSLRRRPPPKAFD